MSPAASDSGQSPMRPGAEPAPPEVHQPAVRAYLLLALTALAAIFLIQLEQAAGLGSFLVLLAGLLGIIARLPSAPLLFLLVLVAQQILWRVSHPGFHRGVAPPAALEVTDVVLCGGVLAYVLAHYRLQGLRGDIVPRDPRRREGPPRWRFWRFSWLPRPVPERRSPRGVSPTEIPVLLLTLPAAALGAQFIWAVLAPRWGPLQLPPPLWRILILGWGLGVALLVASTALKQWRRRQMSAEEAALLLQDVLWLETRREQGRINRWLAWFRLRGRRRKELS
jgi:hypothetical protein